MSVLTVPGGTTNTNFPNWPIAIPVPTGIQAGDVVLVSIASGSVVSGVTMPTGWFQTSLGNVANSTIFLQQWWHIAGASEPSTWSSNATTNTVPSQVIAALFRGVDQVTPIDVTFTSASGTTTPETAPSITVSTNGAMVVSQLVSVNNIHWTAPSTTPATTLYISTGGGNDIYTESPVGSGALAARTFTPSATSGRWIGVSIALRPTSGVAHTGLSGSGSISVSAPAAVQVSMTGLTANNGSGLGNPTPYFNLGNIAWGTSNGPLRNHWLQHTTELIPAPINDATVIYYRFGGGITASITELSVP